MAFGNGEATITLEEILNKITEADIVSYYLGVSKIPCIINSPLRKDNKPSFGLYSPKGDRIYFIDFATKDRGGVCDLLSKMWGCSYKRVLTRIYKDMIALQSIKTPEIHKHILCIIKNNIECRESSDLQCKIRKWEDYDIEYWSSYGISLDWLKYAEIYPISHKIIIKDNHKYVFRADKYAYAYVEHKEGKVTLKIYQPFNRHGYKWSNKHDSSVISLWTKVPEYGEQICICSSLKDALCLWSNTGIPSLAIQGEGYGISNTAISELKRRYKHIYLCLDNDEPGIKDAIKLSRETGFINVVLPPFNEGKDISDLYKAKGKEVFLNIIRPLFNINSNTKN